MLSSPATPQRPEEMHRLAARTRPLAPVVMYQRWRQLLFLHWEYPRDRVQQTLPQGLHVDIFEDRAWVGVVPFFMCDVRPRFFPTVPGISDFMEMNLRAYLHDDCGVPGVWFYSLDANQRLAVALARRLFHLPYIHARMNSEQRNGAFVRYESLRSEAPSSSASMFEYAVGPELAPSSPGSLEFFLIERYHLYATHRGRLLRGTVHHRPYPLCEARVRKWSDRLLVLNGFEASGRKPDHQIMSPGVDVEVFGVRTIRQ